MSDLSSVVPWLTGALVCVLSMVLGWRQRGGGSVSLLMALLKALGLSLLSIFVASWLHTICIDSLHLCRSRGDGNITYALAPVLGLPLYALLILLASPAGRKPLTAAPDPHPLAIQNALLQHRDGQPVSATCPTCRGAIEVLHERIGSQPMQLHTRCRCGRCNARFRRTT